MIREWLYWSKPEVVMYYNGNYEWTIKHVWGPIYILTKAEYVE